MPVVHAVLWEKPVLSGEDNMSHTIANLEYHHFKYALFRQPGHKNYRPCGDQMLRNFLKGLTLRVRG